MALISRAQLVKEAQKKAEEAGLIPKGLPTKDALMTGKLPSSSNASAGQQLLVERAAAPRAVVAPPAPVVEQPKLSPEQELIRQRGLKLGASQYQTQTVPGVVNMPLQERTETIAAPAPTVYPRVAELKPAAPVPTAAIPGVAISARGVNAGKLEEGVFAAPTVPIQKPALAPTVPVIGDLAAAQQAEQLPQFDFATFESADPYTKAAMAAQYEQQQAMAVGQAQLAPYEQMQKRYEGQAGQIGEQIEKLSQLTPEQKKEVEEYKVKAEAAKALRVESARERANEAETQINDALSFAGFGRSTKRAEMLDKVKTSLTRTIADIETETQEAVSRYEVGLLANNQTRIEALQDRLDTVYSNSDRLSLDQAKLSGDVVKSILSASPNNPAKLMEISEKIATAKREDAKLDLEYMKLEQKDREALTNKVFNFVQFGLENFGSDFVNNMPKDSLVGLSEITGVPLDRMKGTVQTLKERQMDFDAMKWEVGRQDQFALREFDAELDLQKMYLGSDLNLQEYGQKAAIDFEKFKGQEQFKSQAETSAAAQRFAGVMSPAYAQLGSSSTGNYISFDTPVPAPNAAIKTPVIATNSKIANFFAQGFTWAGKKLANNLVGQCAWYAQQCTNLPVVGDFANQKQAKLASEIKAGRAFLPGQGVAKPGMTILTNESQKYNHMAVINSITPDGKWVLSESNFAKPLTVTHNRIFDPKSAKLLGVFATKPKEKFIEPKEVLNKAANVDLFGMAFDGAKKAMQGGMGGVKGAVDYANGAAGLLDMFTGAANVSLSNPSQPIPQQAMRPESVEITPDMGVLYQLSQGLLPADTVKDIQKDFYKAGGFNDPVAAAVFTKALKMGATQQVNLTETQSKANWAAGIMESEAKTMDDLRLSTDELEGVDSLISKAINEGKITYETPVSAIMYSKEFSPSQRTFINSLGRWTNAALRQQSGAAISIGEYINTRQQYFPAYGETAEEMEIKRQARDRDAQLLRQGLPKQYQAPLVSPYSSYESALTGGGGYSVAPNYSDFF